RLLLPPVSRWRSSLSSPAPSTPSSSSPGPPLSRVSPVPASPSHRPESPQSSVDSDLGASEAEDDSIALGYKLQDLTDVQVMARLQEESKSRSSAGNSRFHGHLEHAAASSRVFSVVDSPSCVSRQRSRLTSSPLDSYCPGLGDESQRENLARSNLLIFTLPASLLLDKLRRSMPNLVRAPSMPSVPVPANPSASPSLLRNSQSFDSCGGLARLQSSSETPQNTFAVYIYNTVSVQKLFPSPGQLQHRVQSVGNFSSLSRQPLKATAYVSPTIKGSSCPSPSPSAGGAANSGIPLLSKPAGASASAPRSGLPRPASFVAATSSAPRGKAVQSTRSLSALSALRDGAWRDGCY
uniref:SLAIN motif family, member 1a n=1 Tax=Salarias fasciatus TaxID=181472 RepID=A0A672HWI5_SALFA